MGNQLDFQGDTTDKNGYFAIFGGENAKCSYGYPEFDLDKEEIIMDKFGNIYLKEKSHDKA